VHGLREVEQQPAWRVERCRCQAVEEVSLERLVGIQGERLLKLVDEQHQLDAFVIEQNVPHEPQQPALVGTNQGYKFGGGLMPNRSSAASNCSKRSP
jgi:hypothetical protein